MNLDTAIYAQIQPYLLQSRELRLSDEQGKDLVGVLYHAAFDFYGKEVVKGLKTIEHLETLKAGKDFEIVENLCEQQESIVNKTEDKKIELLCQTYNEWVDKYLKSREN